MFAIRHIGALRVYAFEKLKSSTVGNEKMLWQQVKIQKDKWNFHHIRYTPRRNVEVSSRIMNMLHVYCIYIYIHHFSFILFYVFAVVDNATMSDAINLLIEIDFWETSKLAYNILTI